VTCAIRGVIPVLQTPFLDDESIDWESLENEIDWALENKADGVCAAMVSEWLRLTHRERRQYMRVMVDGTAGRGCVIASVGAESTREATELARAAEDAGCHAVMAIPPITVRLPEREAESYYRRIAQATSLPLILQDASGYVGRPLSVELMARLLDAFGPDKILFKPEAEPIGPNLSALRDATAGQARILDGSGGVFLIDAYRRGTVGTIPAVDLLAAIVALWSALETGDDRRAYEVYFPLAALVTLQMQAGLEGFLAIEKYLLVKQGVLPSDRRRGPVGWSLDEETAREVDRLYACLEEVVADAGGHDRRGAE